MFTHEILIEMAIEFGGLILLVCVEELFFSPKHS